MSDVANVESRYKKTNLRTGLEIRGAKRRRDLIKDKSKLAELANTDPLTGLDNRRQFSEDLIIAISNFERFRTPFSIAEIDLKDFKLINDTLGHLKGDKALIFIGSFLKSHIRPGDKVARYGGDEFLILLNETTQKGADTFLYRLGDNFEFLKAKKTDLKPEEQMTKMNKSARQWSSRDSYEVFMERLDQKMFEEKRG